MLATLVSVSGSSYRRPGARLLIADNGAKAGSISGGCLEDDVLARAKRVAATGQAELVTYDTTSENDLVWGVGLGCHGVVRVLLERIIGAPAWALTLARNLEERRPTRLEVTWQANDAAALGTRLVEEPLPFASAVQQIFQQEIMPPARLVIFGAGDDARPLCQFAKGLGWHVTVADPRRDFASPERFPEADAVVIAPAGELVTRARFQEDCLAVVMTHHYVHDVPVLRSLLSAARSYVGLLGPKKRGERIIGDLQTEGCVVSVDFRSRLHTPVGLDLGAETPQEVALSIIAEIQAYLTRHDARPLRERMRPIHG